MRAACWLTGIAGTGAGVEASVVSSGVTARGVGVVVPRDYKNPPTLDRDFERAEARFAELTYKDLDHDRDELLGLVRDPVDVEKELVSAGIW